MPSTTARCPDCGSAIYTDADEQLCEDCGLVVDSDRLDRGPEWRSFADDDTNPKRTGSPLTDARHDRGLSTEIGHTAELSAAKRRQFVRLRRQHNRARLGDKRTRNQVHAFTRIKHVVSNKSLPTQVRDHACRLFRSAQQEDLLRGRSIEGFVAACLYAVCRIGVALADDRRDHRGLPQQPRRVSGRLRRAEPRARPAGRTNPSAGVSPPVLPTNSICRRRSNAGLTSWPTEPNVREFSTAETQAGLRQPVCIRQRKKTTPTSHRVRPRRSHP